jgi:hypothetical protein
MRPYLKNNQSKKGWWVAAHLPSKCEALNLSPSTAKKKKIKKNQKHFV